MACRKNIIASVEPRILNRKVHYQPSPLFWVVQILTAFFSHMYVSWKWHDHPKSGDSQDEHIKSGMLMYPRAEVTFSAMLFDWRCFMRKRICRKHNCIHQKYQLRLMQ